MESVFLVLTVLTVAGFGFFWAYERTGPAWSAVLSLVCLNVAAVASALAEADATTVSWQLSFNVVVFNSFALGYTLGYPRKRPWYKKTVAATSFAIVALFAYMTWYL